MKLRARTAATLIVLVVSMAGCGGSSDNTSAESTRIGLGVTEDAGMGEPAAAFAAHFTDAVYEDVSDGRAPFGSDEGADMLAEWTERRDQLGPRSTVADVLGDEPFEYQSSDDIYSLAEVQAAGFTLLRLTGQIDADGKRATLDAIDSLITHWYGQDPQLLRQRDDLRSWVE